MLGLFYDLGSGWLKMERRELSFQFSCVNEWTQTFSYLKQTTFGKGFFHLSGVLSWYWWVPISFRASWHCLGRFLCCCWMGIHSRLWKYTNELQKFSALAVYFQRPLNIVPLTISVCWKANYSSPHFHFQRSFPILTNSENILSWKGRKWIIKCNSWLCTRRL